jgi:hypothetical protein
VGLLAGRAVLIGSALALLAAPPAATPRPKPPRPEWTWEAADGLEGRLKAIEAGWRSKRAPAEPRLLVRQAELNSYVNLTLAAQLPPGVTELEFQIEKDRVSAKGMLDLDQLPVKQAAGASPWSPINFLSGKVPVELRGRLTSQDGFGSFEPEDIRLATIPVPASLLAQAVAQATRTSDNPQGFDILSPFRLPYGARRVRLQPAKILVDF